MFILKKICCRIFQIGFRGALPILPYRETETVDSCKKLDKVFKKENITAVLVVTDKGIVNSGIAEAVENVLKESNIRYTVYDKTMPNPTVKNVEEAYNIYKTNNCNCLIAVGGGSSMDCAKAVGARAVYPKKTVGQMKGVLRVLRRLPTLIAIPTTAGT